MSDKVERLLTLNRQRVEKHRSLKRAKVEYFVPAEPADGSESDFEQNNQTMQLVYIPESMQSESKHVGNASSSISNVIETHVKEGTNVYELFTSEMNADNVEHRESTVISVNNHETKILQTVATQTEELDGSSIFTEKKMNELLRKCVASLKTYIDKQLSPIQTKLDEIKTLCQERRSLSGTDEIVTYHDFVNKHQEYEFPLKSTEMFNKFLNDIKKEDSETKKDLKSHWLSTLNFDVDILDNITIIIKRLLSKEVIKEYTVQRFKSGKLIFKDTELYNLLEATLLASYNSNPQKSKITEKQILLALGSVFANAKDWDGGRTARYHNQKRSFQCA